MKLGFAVIPCLNDMVMKKVWDVVNTGLEEFVALGFEPITVLELKTAIYSGQKTIELIYKDDLSEEAQKIPEQERAALKLLKGQKQDYVGFLITELHRDSFHGYGIYLTPENRGIDILTQVQSHFEETARKWTAPNATFCTGYDQAALMAGYTKKYSMFSKKL